MSGFLEESISKSDIGLIRWVSKCHDLGTSTSRWQNRFPGLRDQCKLESQTPGNTRVRWSDEYKNGLQTHPRPQNPVPVLVCRLCILSRHPIFTFQIFIMVPIKIIFLFVANVFALNAIKRSVNTTLKDINTISSNLNSLSSAVNDYQGGIIGALPIATGSTTLGYTLTSATRNLAGLSSITPNAEDSILQAISILQPTINSTFTSMISKAPMLRQFPLGSIVEFYLTTLNSDVDGFASALRPYATGSRVADLDFIIRNITKSFLDTIAAFRWWIPGRSSLKVELKCSSICVACENFNGCLLQLELNYLDVSPFSYNASAYWSTRKRAGAECPF